MLKRASQPLRAYFNNRFEALNTRVATLEMNLTARLDSFSANAMDIFSSLGRSSSKLVDGVERLESRLDALSSEVADLKFGVGGDGPWLAEAALVQGLLADLPADSRILVLSGRHSPVAQSFAALGFDTSQLEPRVGADGHPLLTTLSGDLDGCEPFDVVISLSTSPGAKRHRTTADVRDLARPGGRLIISEYHENPDVDLLAESDIVGRHYLIRDNGGSWTASREEPAPGTTAIALVTAVNSSR